MERHLSGASVACLVLSVASFSFVAATENATALRVRTFLETPSPYGVTYFAAKDLGADAIPLLIQTLHNPAASEHWEKTVYALGIIGDSSARQPLINFLESGRGRVSDVEYQAKRGVPVALGYILNQSKDEKILDYLTGGVQTSVWERRIHWTSKALPTNVARNTYLTRKSILALGIAGTVESKTALSNHHCAIDEKCVFRDVMTQAIALNSKMQDNHQKPSLAWYLDQTVGAKPSKK